MFKETLDDQKLDVEAIQTFACFVCGDTGRHDDSTSAASILREVVSISIGRGCGVGRSDQHELQVVDVDAHVVSYPSDDSVLDPLLFISVSTVAIRL